MRTPFLFLIISIFIYTSIIGPLPARGDMLDLPAPGVRVALSPAFHPVVLRGMTVHPENPFLFDFILAKGDKAATDLSPEVTRLVKYFLASLTMPGQDLWVNLSPYEKDRIVPEAFGQTGMGRDLLAQDYLLKQVTSSLMYPEDQFGKNFWDKIYTQAKAQYGITTIPVNTFNKVWIVPDVAKVYEHGHTAFIVKAHLKVMLEGDYLASSHAPVNVQTQDVGKQVIKELIIPALEKEINEGKNFAMLRQVYDSLILATWFKKRLKSSLLGQKYMDQKKVNGIKLDKTNVTDIYERYLAAYKKGVYNYIKEEPDPSSGEFIPHKYFAGGAQMGRVPMTWASASEAREAAQEDDFSSKAMTAQVKINVDRAMPPEGNQPAAVSMPSHWRPEWPVPTPVEIQEAKETLDLMFNKDFQYTGEIFMTERKSNNASILRAIYYLDPDLGGAILTGFFHKHGSWVSFLEKPGVRHRTLDIEILMLTDMLNYGLGMMRKKQRHISYKGISKNIEYSLTGIVGLMTYLDNSWNVQILASIKESYFPLMVDAMAVYVANRKDAYPYLTKIVYNLIKTNAKRIKRNLSKVSAKGRAYLETLDALVVAGVRRLPRVKQAIPRLPGRAIGKLVIFNEDYPELSKLKDPALAKAVVAMEVLPTSDPEIAPFRGILTFRQTAQTSHAEARAEMLGVPHALWPGPETLRPLEGKIVVFEVSGHSVSIREATATEALSQEAASDIILPHVELPDVNTGPGPYFLPLGSPELMDPREVGYKVALLNRLARHAFKISVPDVELSFATGSALPFRTFVHLLQTNGKEDEFRRLLKELSDPLQAEATIKSIQQMIMNLSIDPTESWVEQINAAAPWEQGVFVRAATIAENLPGFPGFGSGMYKTVPNVKTQQAFWQGVLEVYASTWSLEAFHERRKFNVDESKVYPACWLVWTLPAAHAFNIETTHAANGHATAEFVQGTGESLVGDEDELFVGLPTTVKWDKASGIEIDRTKSTKELRSVLDDFGGTVVESADPAEEFLDQEGAGRALQAMQEITAQVEAILGRQELEGNLGRIKNKYIINMLQSRLTEKKDHAVVDQILSNAAMGGSRSKELGGIDFNPDRINLQVDSSSQASGAPADAAQMANIEINGLSPQVIKIGTIDLNAALGFTDNIF